MSEWCKECFIDGLMTTKEQEKVEQGKITFVLTEFNDFCEGCSRMKPVVAEVKESM